MTIGVMLDTKQDEQMLDDFIEAKRGVICSIMRDRLVNSSKSNRIKRYIDASELYGWAMMITCLIRILCLIRHLLML